MPPTSADGVRLDLQRRRRALLETARRADAERDGLRTSERIPEFEEEARTDREADTLARLGEAQRRELAQIDAALGRLDAGAYGTCADCAQPIDPRRLKALPYALVCAECAAGRERAPGTGSGGAAAP